VAPHVLGQDPFLVAALWQKAWAGTAMSGRRGIAAAALAAVDIALWDLLGKITGQPLYRLLGAAGERVRCYASGGLYGPERTPESLGGEVADALARGFVDFKLKVGGAALAEDVARVAAARRALGPGGRLMVDAVYSLDVPGALRLARALGPQDVYWFEAPVHPDDVAGAARVNRDGGIPVCGNENEHGIDRYRELVTARAVDYVQFNLSACGGITEGRRIAALAGAFRLPVTLQASSSCVLLAASLHLAAALPHCDSVEYHMVHQWLREKAPAGAFAVEDGWMRPPAGAGLGVPLHCDDVE
jgi:L-alanine-DL-glutamate epimerase-like enolase superfamily enzyme